MRFLFGEHALSELGAAGEAVGKIQSLRNHDARIAVGPVGGRGALKRNAEAELKRGKIVGGGAFVVGVADGENLAREDAGLGDGARVGDGRFGFENRENDGVAFDEDLFGQVTVQKFLDGFVQIEAEVRGRVQAPGEQILRHSGGAAHVGLNDDVRDDVVLLRLGFPGQDALIEAVVDAGKLASLFRGDEADAFHAGGQMLRVTEVAPKAEKVSGKAQDETLHLFAGVAANLSREFLDILKRQFLRGHLLDNLLDLLHLLFGHQRLAQLLQVDRRVVVGNNRPDFVTGKDVVQNLVLFQEIEKPQQQTFAHRRFRSTG